MNPWIGWLLAGALVYFGWAAYGWQGLLFAGSVVVFWLLLQFSRVMRVMQKAGEQPVGHVESAVMLNAKLRERQSMLDLVRMTRSLGRRVSEAPDVWRWSDPGGVAVDVTFEHGRVARWSMQRPAE